MFTDETGNTLQKLSVKKELSKSIENAEKFLSENKDILEQYMEFKQSNVYKNSLAYKIQALLKEFNKTSGYYDILL